MKELEILSMSVDTCDHIRLAARSLVDKGRTILTPGEKALWMTQRSGSPCSCIQSKMLLIRGAKDGIGLLFDNMFKAVMLVALKKSRSLPASTLTGKVRIILSEYCQRMEF